MIHVTPDYLAVGSSSDFFRMPMTPLLAQWVADLTSTSLPTRRMVDTIYAEADIKLPPSQIPPSPQMTTIPVFWEHEQIIRAQRAGYPAPAGALVAGHKKDVILSVTTEGHPPPPRVSIYGWHRSDGTPIQPLSTVHKSSYADYSHGIRLVSREAEVDGASVNLDDVLTNAELDDLLNDEAVPFGRAPRYPTPPPPGLPAR